jgi:hypothetical protein
MRRLRPPADGRAAFEAIRRRLVLCGIGGLERDAAWRAGEPTEHAAGKLTAKVPAIDPVATSV